MANINRTAADYNDRLSGLRMQASNGEFRTPTVMETAIRTAAEAHVTDRIARSDIVGTREDMVGNLVPLWTIVVTSAIEAREKTRDTRVLTEAASRVAAAPSPGKELRLAAVDLVSGQAPPPTGAGREIAIRKAMDDIRSETERRHAVSNHSRRQEQEADLVRQSMSNLSDMPKEIRMAAEKNMTENRSPFEGDKARKPAEAEGAIRTEEARLRSVVEAGRASIQQQQASAMMAAQRGAVRQACDVQADVAGSSVVTPYSRRAGIFGSALAGAIESTVVQERVRADCYRLNGL